jgi:hypothetical protein
LSVIGWAPARIALILLIPAWSLLAGLPVCVAILITLLVGAVAMRFLAAVGIWCSARYGTSWRSLLTTVGLGYIGGTVVLCVSAPLALISWLLFSFTAEILDTTAEELAPQNLSWGELAESLTPLLLGVGSALVFWWVSHALIVSAEEYLESVERIPRGRHRLFDVERPTTVTRDAEAAEPSAFPPLNA